MNVNKFTTKMQEAYDNNAHKKHPSECTQNELLAKLDKVHYNLRSAVCKNEHGKVMKLTPDLSNYAKFLYDNASHSMEER